jgi:hypothetical protein
VRRIKEEGTRRAPVTVDRWSSPVEGTYDDDSAVVPKRSRDEAPEPAPAAPAEAAVNAARGGVRMIRRATLPHRRHARRAEPGRASRHVRSVRQVTGAPPGSDGRSPAAPVGADAQSPAHLASAAPTDVAPTAPTDVAPTAGQTASQTSTRPETGGWTRPDSGPAAAATSRTAGGGATGGNAGRTGAATRTGRGTKSRVAGAAALATSTTAGDTATRAAGNGAAAVAPSVGERPKVSLLRRVSLTRTHPKRRRVSLIKSPAQQRAKWLAFAPPPVRPPGRVARTVAAVWRGLAHEYTVASLGSVLLAVIMTWPTLRHPTRTIPQDLGDPVLQAWQLAWSGHALRTDPANLWHSNTFYPERYSFAFSDTLLGLAPFGLVGSGVQATILRYNIVFTLAFALAFLGTYALVRQLGAVRIAAVVAGAAFAYAPWRWGQAGHLHVLSSGGIVLALAMLARGHGFSLRHGYRADQVRPGWAVAGWAVAAWQVSLGFGIGLPFVYGMALLVVVVVGVWAVVPLPQAPLSWLRERPGAWVRAWWTARTRIPRLLLAANLGGGLLFAGVGAAMAYPYLKVVEEHPNARRGMSELLLYSPPAHGFLTAPAESWLWGDRHSALRATLLAPTESALLPGFVLLALAMAGLLYSVWPYYVRFLLLVGMLGSIVLAMGTEAPFGGKLSYVILHQHVPGFDGIRTPGRLVLWTTLFAAVLAAGVVSAFAEGVREYTAARFFDRPGPMLRLALLLPLVLVLVEGTSGSQHPEVPPPPAAMRQAESPMLVLPSDQLSDEMIMMWGTDGFPTLVNGGSGFTPARQQEVREIVTGFPDAASIRLLRDLGVRSVVVIKSMAEGSPYAAAIDADVDGLDIEREDTGDAVIYRL